MASIWAFVRDHSDLEEAEFVDAVERRLRQSRFLVLIIGDGIQAGVEALTAHLQLHAGVHVGLAIVDLSLWRDPSGWLLVLPRVPMRTLLVERGVVIIDPSAPVQLVSAQGASGSKISTPRATTASEPEFFEQLEQRRPGLAERVKHFLTDIASLGVEPEFRKSPVLRWQASPDFDASPGYIDTSGKVWFGSAWTAANRLGNAAAGDRYLETVAAILEGKIKRYEKNAPDVVGHDGRGADAAVLLSTEDRWKHAIGVLIEETRPTLR